MSSNLRGVITVVEFDDRKEVKYAKNSSSCSGILVNSRHGIIITTGTLLSSLLKKNEAPKINLVSRLGRLVGYGEKRNLLLKHVKFSVIVEKDTEELYTPVTYSATLISMCRCSAIRKELSNLMKDNWTPISSKSITDEEINFQIKSLTLFLILQIQDEKYSSFQILIPYYNLTSNLDFIFKDAFVQCWKECGNVVKGDKVYCESSLFGDLCPNVFMNSLSQGIVVNKFGPLFLTDARCVPGSEGGLVFQKQDNGRRLWLGIINAALSWNQKELIGLSLACSAKDIISNILTTFNCSLLPTPIPIGYQTTPITTALRSVVIVKNGLAWGSGIIVDKVQRIIITCSHVVKNSDHVKIEIHCPEDCEFDARVIYKASEGKVPDVAVLKIDDKIELPNSVLISDKPIKLGDEVLAVGFPIFPPNCKTGVHVTGGIISRVVSSNGVQILLQTSCCVIGGASGGLILDARSGLGLGMIVCNAKDSTSNVTFPSINLAVPLSVINPVLVNYLNSRDEKTLLQLENTDINVERLWKLGKVTAVPDAKL